MRVGCAVVWCGCARAEIVLRTGQLLKDLFTQSFLGRQLHSALVLPLVHRGRLFGAVYLMSTGE